MERDEVDRLLAADEDALFAAMGRSLLPETDRDLGPKDLRRVVDVGKLWLRNTQSEIHALICDDPRVIAARAASDENGARLLLVLADVLAAQKGWPPPATVGALILKIGFDRFCAGEAEG